MPVLITHIIVAVAAYLLGSIPTGFLVAKAKGIDIRKTGSGNIGATNAMRVLGKPAGIFVLLMDAAKGFAAVSVAYFISTHIGAPDYFKKYTEAAMQSYVLAGIFAVLGHNYTCWLKFKGGKGIATTAGVFLALAPMALGIAFAVFILTIFVTRYVSVGSICAAIALALTIDFTNSSDSLVTVTNSLAVLAIYRHKSNLQRLMAGTENKIGKKTARGDARPTNQKESEDAK